MSVGVRKGDTVMADVAFGHPPVEGEVVEEAGDTVVVAINDGTVHKEVSREHCWQTDYMVSEVGPGE